MEFYERLRALRKERGLSQKALAEQLRISTFGYQKFESGQNMPNMVVVVALAGIFQVSLDYLAGLSDDPARH